MKKKTIILLFSLLQHTFSIAFPYECVYLPFKPRYETFFIFSEDDEAVATIYYASQLNDITLSADPAGLKCNLKILRDNVFVATCKPPHSNEIFHFQVNNENKHKQGRIVSNYKGEISMISCSLVTIH